MKFGDFGLLLTKIAVALYMSAWIEIVEAIKSNCGEFVALYMSAWIEI